jgi:glycosyltransferase involved in cell wall biosynthesis
VIQLHGPLVMFAQTMGWPATDSEFYRTGTIMEGACLRLADAVYSSSSCSADWCARSYGLAREHIPVLHTGVDCRVFYPRAVAKEGRPTIIFVGRIHPDKGVDLLLEAACILSEEYPDLRVRMLGRGDDDLVDELRTRAIALGFPDLLDLAGFVDRYELPEHLSRSHVFAAPSLYEGGPGFVYLEAMACGLPVIACAGSGAAEIVQHGERGLLVSPGDKESLVQALRRLLSNAAAREAMGARARDYVLAEADSEICLGRIEAFYRAVTAGRPETAEVTA